VYIFGVQYYSIPTQDIQHSRWTQNQNEQRIFLCHNKSDMGLNLKCHDFLLDQSVVVDVKQYKRALNPFVQQLKNSYSSLH
jgi:hypothetical protein